MPYRADIAYSKASSEGWTCLLELELQQDLHQILNKCKTQADNLPIGHTWSRRGDSKTGRNYRLLLGLHKLTRDMPIDQ